MKKLFMALCFAFIAILAVNAQSQLQVNPSTYQSVVEQNILVDANNLTDDFVFDMTKIGKAYYYAIPVKFNGAQDLATVTDPRVTILLQGGNDNETWANIDTVSYACDADTTFEFSETSHVVGYSYLRVHTVGDDSLSLRLNRLVLRFVH